MASWALRTVLSALALVTLTGFGTCTSGSGINRPPNTPFLNAFSATSSTISGTAPPCVGHGLGCSTTIYVVALGGSSTAPQLDSTINPSPDDEFVWTLGGLAPDTPYTIWAVNKHGTKEQKAGPYVYATASSPPDAPGATPPGTNQGFHAGTTAGAFDVGPTGDAKYKIPIAVPPGTRDLEPELALVYSSHRRNGPLGSGWSLSGLSSITRCATNLAQDGLIDGVDFDANDQLCLDGRRLVPTAGGAEYRTRIESFSRIVPSGSQGSGPASFQVWTKSGLILEYGVTSDSRIEAQGHVQGSGDVVIWALNRVEDRFGNYMTLTYLEDNASTSGVVSQIDYTGNGALPPYASVRFSYEARPEDYARYLSGSALSNPSRLTSIETYVGSERVREYRLAYDNFGAGGASRLLSVEECTGDATQICLAPTTFDWSLEAVDPVHATGFWEGFGMLGPNFEFTGAWTSGNNYFSNERFYAGDFNGDGITDLFFHRDKPINPNSYAPADYGLAFGTGSGFVLKWTGNYCSGVFPDTTTGALGYCVTENTLFYPGDYNGDGKTDLFAHKSGLTAYYALLISDGTRLISTDTTFCGDPLEYMGVCVSNSTSFYPGDYDGDGRTDLFVHRAYTGLGQGTFYATAFSNGTHVIATAVHSGCNGDLAPICVGDDTRFTPGDFNGDGLTDLFTLRGAFRQYTVSLSEWVAGQPRLVGGAVQSACTGFIGECIENSTEFVPGDFNGDGNTDLVVFDPASHNGFNHWIDFGFAYSDGTKPVMMDGPLNPGGSFNKGCSNTALGWCGSKGTVWVPGDFNGDGLTDLFVYQGRGDLPSPTTYYGTLISEGDFLREQQVSYEGAQGYLGAEITHFTVVNPGDFDGDGKTDLFFHDYRRLDPWPAPADDAQWLAYSQGPIPDKLLSLTNGLGAETLFTYGTTADPALYTSSTSSSYPERDLTSPSLVVAEVEQSDGLGAYHKAEYAYEDLKADLHLRRTLGFRRVATTEEDLGLTREITFRQDFPFQGKIEASSRTITATGGELERVENIWSSLTLDPGLSGERDFVFVDVKTTKRFKLASPHHQFLEHREDTDVDSFGNPTQVEEKWFDGPGTGTPIHTRTTLNSQYTNDESTWLLGLPGRIAVSRVNDGGAPVTRTLDRFYDTAGPLPTGVLLQEVIEPDLPLGDPQHLVTDFSPDGFGNVETTVVGFNGPKPRTTTVEYDSQGRFPTSETNSLGQQTLLEFHDHFGTPTRREDPNGLVTTWDYDGLGRQIRETRPDATQTVQHYTACDPAAPCIADAQGAPLVATVQVSGGSPSSVYFDELGREILRESASFDGLQSVLARTRYDLAGRVAAVSRPYFEGGAILETTTSYDLLGRVKTVQAPDSGQTTNSYDGLTAVTTNALLQTRTVVRNSLDQVVQVRDDDDVPFDYEYDAFGSLERTTDFFASQTVYTYDLRGRTKSVDDPNGGLVEFDYSAFGDLLLEQNARGEETSFSYDELGRLEVRDSPEGIEVFEYDSAWVGEVTEEDGLNGYLRRHAYDALGRRVNTMTRVNGLSYYMSRTSDRFGRPGVTAYPAGLAVSNEYNAQGELDVVRNLHSGVAVWQAMSRDPDGQLTQALYGNGIQTTRVYDPLTGRIDSISSTGGDPGSDQNLTFDFDLLGRLEGRENFEDDIVGSESFLYDGLNRLKDSMVPGQSPRTFSYDEVGNLTSKSDVGTLNYGGSAGGPHAVTSKTKNGNTKYYAYDASGNMACLLTTTISPPSACDGGTALEYNSFNKPISIKKSSTGYQALFEYGTDRRRSRQTAGILGEAVDTIYVDVLHERVTTTTLTASTVQQRNYVEAAGEIVAVHIQDSQIWEGYVASQATTRYLHYDHIGSVELVTDETGAKIERLSYDAHGRRRALDGTKLNPANIDSPVVRGFTGHEHLDDLQLVHMTGRIYDPTIGRMLSVDPIVSDALDAQSFNAYSYVVNDPLGLTDPTGFGFTLNDIFGEFLGFAISPGYATLLNLSIKIALEVANDGSDDSAQLSTQAALAVDQTPTPLQPEKIEDTLSQEPGRVENRVGEDSLRVSRDTSPSFARDAIDPSQSDPAGQQQQQFDPNNGRAEPAVGPVELIGGIYAIGRGLVRGLVNGLLRGGADDLARGADDLVGFGRNANQLSHTFRHVEAAGLQRGPVQDAIRTNLRTVDLAPGKLHTGTVDVGGQTLRFNAFKLPDGSINVGRITVD